MLISGLWRRIKLVVAQRPVGLRASIRPTFLYRDLGLGDVEQGMRLVRGHFCFDRADYSLSLQEPWRGEWPVEVRRWLYSFVWLCDLQALGTNEARLTARALIRAWVDNPPEEALVQEPGIMGQRLANWLGYYEFCLMTALECTQRRVMETIQREGRILSAFLPLEPCGWEGLAALRGLLAAFMALPDQQGFYLRFQRYLPLELERLVLADGTVAERSPEAQFQTVRELACLAQMFTALRVAAPPVIQEMTKKTCSVLRALCHGDGCLALFNGSVERQASEISLLLERVERYHVLTPVLPQGGFIRIALGRSLFLVDADVPPGRGFDRKAHAGTLSFEFSHDACRIFVNSGAAFVGAWRTAFRESTAHNVAVLEGESSSQFSDDGHIIRCPSHVSCSHHHTEEAHWLDLSHDGYHASLGAIWHRSFYLGGEGEDLRGRESFEADCEFSSVLRFYVHPAVRVSQEDEDVILYASKAIWRFRQVGGHLRVEDAVYLGRGLTENNQQIVVSSRLSDHFVDPSGHKRYWKRISWVLERVPD